METTFNKNQRDLTVILEALMKNLHLFILSLLRFDETLKWDLKDSPICLDLAYFQPKNKTVK